MLRDEEILEALVPYNFWGKPQETGIEREEYLEKIETFCRAGDFIIAIIGPRRAGKTFLARQFLKRKISQGLNPKQTLYVNLEDPKFHAYLSLELLDEIYRVYKIHINDGDFSLIVLDEVQNLPNWERWVRSITEKENVKVIVTGSTSSLLKTEVSGVLTGRSLTLEVFPLTFREFLSFKGLNLRSFAEIIANKIKIERLLAEYMEFGGFPQVVLVGDEYLKREILKELFEGIVIRDVAFRHGFKELNTVKLIAQLSVNRFASLVSGSSLRNEVAGIVKRKVSPNFVIEVLEALEESYLIFRTPPLSYKVGDVKRHPRKLYVVDPGIINAVTLRFSKNIGRLAENIVALHLIKRFGKENVFYYKGEREVDFLIKEGLEVTKAIQVSWDLSESKKREVKGLLEAMEEFSLKEGVIITSAYEGLEEIKGKRIRYIPLWKFLLLE